MRLLHFSDLHLGIEAHGRPDPATGINQRVLDFAARLDELVAFALQEGVDVVLFAGDAFRNSHPAPSVQKMLAQRVRRLAKAGVHVFLLAGNHDLPRMVADVTAFSVYSALETDNVTVAERPGLYRVRGRSGAEVQIAAIPHFWPRAALAAMGERAAADGVDRLVHTVVSEKVTELGAMLDPAVPAILTAHLMLAELTPEVEDHNDVTELRVPLRVLMNPAFAYVALGHVHERHEFNFDRFADEPVAAYSGSLDRVTFREEDHQKGFYVLDLAGPRLPAPPRFVPVAARRFLTIRTEPYADDPTDEVVAAIERAQIADAVVRVYVEAPRDRFGMLDKARVRAALAPAYESSVIPAYPDEHVEVRDVRFANTDMTYQDALAAFARSEYGKDAEEVIRLGNEVIDEVLGA